MRPLGNSTAAKMETTVMHGNQWTHISTMKALPSIGISIGPSITVSWQIAKMTAACYNAGNRTLFYI